MLYDVDGHPGGTAADFQTPPGRLLVVDDDYSIRRILHRLLYDQGYEVAEASCADEAMALARAIRYDVTLLDINLPGKDGVTLCRELRSLFPRLAILILTVKDGQNDRVEALDAGADDYIVKPFHMRELMARIRAAVRRVQIQLPENTTCIRIGEISLDAERRAVQKGGEAIHLTPKEFEVLHYLMRHAGQPVHHVNLLGSVWGPEYSSQTEYLRTFVKQLRRKLESDPGEPRYLLTESHIGYRFADSATLLKASHESGNGVAKPE